MKINFKSKKQIIILIIIAVTLSFIFGQSMLSMADSLENSLGFAGTLDTLFEPELVPKPVEPAPDNSGNSSSGNSESSAGNTDAQPEKAPTETPPEDNTDEEVKEDIDKEQEIIYEKKPRPVIDFIIANVRKVAHFVEHGLFGIEIFLLMLFIERDSGKERKIFPIGIKSVLIALNIGILVALFDESIQILSARGPSVSDIWLDISGYATFVAVMFAVFTIVKSVILLIKSAEKGKSIA